MFMVRGLLVFTFLLYIPSSLGLDVTFSDRSTQAGVGRSTESYGASVADTNGDGYPDIYVSNHRERPSLYVNQRNGTFVDAAASVQTWMQRPGADTHGGGFADVDNDGDLDFLVTTGRGNDQQFFINQAGTLVDRTTAWTVGSPLVGGRLAVWYDYNGDRLLDMSVPQYGGVSPMYTNRGDRFSEDTSALSSVCVRHMYAQLLDVSGDGVLDFICSGEQTFPQAVFDMTTVPWRRITSEFPVVDHVVDSVLGDFNNDGRMDMFLISNQQTRPSNAAQHGTRQVEFRTQGGLKAISFVSDGDITIDLDWNLFKRSDFANFIFIGASGRHPTGFPLTLSATSAANHGMPASAPANRVPAILIGFNDATNRWSIVTQTDNEWSDAYFTVNTVAPVTGLNVTGLWPTDRPSSPTLLTATATGWADTTAAAGLAGEVLCGSVTTGDFNNDMYLDLYLACREGAANTPNVLYFGGPGGFRRAANAAGAEGPTGAAIGSGAGTADTAVSADFDLDGFLDLFVTNGFNMRPTGVGGPGKLFRNSGNSNRWLMLDLVGTGSNRDGVGARVTATASGVTQFRVQNGNYHRWAQEHARMHFGLGTAQRVNLVIDWPSGQRDFHNDVLGNRIYRATEGGELTVVNPASGPPTGTSPCGAPSYDPSSQPGFYVWRACGSNAWSMRAVAGGGGIRYTGDLRSDVAYNSVTPFSVESNDVLDTSDPRNIRFILNAGGQWEDGANFVVAPSSGKCFSVAGAGSNVYFGPDATPVPASFNPETLQSCGSAPPQPPAAACGRPNYDPASDPGFYVWQECGGNGWGVRAVAGGSNIQYSGSFDSDVALTGVTPFSLESNDVLNASNPSRVVFSFTAGGQWEDGFAFTAAASSGKCFNVTGAGSNVYFGANATPVPSSFNPQTLQACGSSPPQQPVATCGQPNYDPASEPGFYLWESCAGGSWSARAVAGGSSITYSGNLRSDVPYASVTPISVESNDVLNTADPRNIAFSFVAGGQWQDGVNFVVADSPGKCFSVTGAGSNVYVGGNKVRVPASFNPKTLLSCP